MKRLIKRVILQLGAWLGRDEGPKVVFYHDIGKKYTAMGTEEGVFWAHMGRLRAGDRVCFDDGFRGIWDAKERLGVRGQGLGARVTVFLAVELVGKEGYLTWEEIRELQDAYGVEFQSHTWSHQTLAGSWNSEVAEPAMGRTEEWFEKELKGSKAELERRLGRKVTAICFPVGNFSEETVRRCKAAGYEKAYGSFPGKAIGGFVEGRCLAQDLTAKEFELTLKGGMAILRKWYLRKQRFV